MSRSKKEISIGSTFGRLTTISDTRLHTDDNGVTFSIVDVKCNCGVIKAIRTNKLIRNHAKSCGNHGKGQTIFAKTAPLGSKQRTSDGYLKIKTEEGWKIEHRYIMEQILNHQLFNHENVHHKNGIRDDNRPENLELWSTSQPCGQRVEDKLKWCYDFIRQYEEI